MAGSTIAIRLAMAGINVHLFERHTSLINAPPMCHLHAGGNLYREISDEDCMTLLRQCIDIAQLYPDSIDVRPTVITVPIRDMGTADELLPRLQLLKQYYRALVAQDVRNRVLGEPDDYYRLYEQADLIRLATADAVAKPTNTDEWLIPVAKLVNLEKLQWPIIAVQEYGWNIFRLSASAFLQLTQHNNAHLHFNTTVNDLRPDGKRWSISFSNEQGETQSLIADFVINAAGFRTGIIDDQARIKVDRMVEFKASYLSHWQGYAGQLPEIIFHGERGTSHGMAQFTPYPEGIFQLHGMTEQVTLFKDGLTRSRADSSQPPLKPQYLNYIEQGWDQQSLAKRAQNAIDYVSEFIPAFCQAAPINNALYGAQQIPSDDINLRVADLQVFAEQHYAIAENVKANSTLDVADGVVEALIDSGLLAKSARQRPVWPRLKTARVDKLARHLAIERGYPVAMAGVNNPLRLTK